MRHACSAACGRECCCWPTATSPSPAWSTRSPPPAPTCSSGARTAADCHPRATCQTAPRTPAGIDQETHALLVTYQALRLAIADATAGHPTSPDRASFTVALHAARDQLIHAAGVTAGTTIDLTGHIGRAVLARLLPPRPTRICPRVVKRAISKHRAKGTIDRTNYQAAITINILTKLTAGRVLPAV